MRYNRCSVINFRRMDIQIRVNGYVFYLSDRFILHVQTSDTVINTITQLC